MEDRGGEHRIGACLERLAQMLRSGSTTRGDHRHLYRIAHRPDQLEVVAGARAVAIPAGEQDLAGALRRRLARPTDRIDAGALAAALDQDLEAAVAPCRIDRQDRALAAEVLGDRGEQRRLLHGCGVDRDLVGAGLEQRPCIVEAAHAAADGQRNAQLRTYALHRLDLVAAALGRRRDVEDHDLVGPLRLVQRGALGRIAGVAQALEAHALDHAAVAHVEAGDDARRQHSALQPAGDQAMAERAGKLGVELAGEQRPALERRDEGLAVLGRVATLQPGAASTRKLLAK